MSAPPLVTIGTGGDFSTVGSDVKAGFSPLQCGSCGGRALCPMKGAVGMSQSDLIASPKHNRRSPTCANIVPSMSETDQGGGSFPDLARPAGTEAGGAEQHAEPTERKSVKRISGASGRGAI